MLFFKSLFRVRKNRLVIYGVIFLACVLILDYGQVSYIYRFMTCILAIAYKFVYYVALNPDAETVRQDFVPEARQKKQRAVVGECK